MSGVGEVLTAVGAGGSRAVASPHARLAISILIIACLGFAVASCRSEGNGERLGERVIPMGQPVPKGGGVYRTGDAYQVDGVWYRPREDPTYNRIGTASWYGELFHGRRTANGEIYDMDRLSAASPTLPMPVYARVTNLANGRTLVVRVNDRGPYANDRVIDLSRRSAELLGFRNSGTAQVRVQYLARAPMNGDDSYERRYLASQRWVHMAASEAPLASDPPDVGSVPDQDRPLPDQDADAAGGWKAASSRPPDMAAPQGTGPLRWQAAAQAPPPPRVVSAPAAQPSMMPRLAPVPQGGAPPKRLLVQAGSFKSKENADRARAQLAGLAPVDVAPLEVGGETYFRVRVGPFSGDAEASAALARVTQAGYAGAKIVGN